MGVNVSGKSLSIRGVGVEVMTVDLKEIRW
jgi:hypothetical protein